METNAFDPLEPLRLALENDLIIAAIFASAAVAVAVFVAWGLRR